MLIFHIRPLWIPVYLYYQSTLLAMQFQPIFLGCRHSVTVQASFTAHQHAAPGRQRRPCYSTVPKDALGYLFLIALMGWQALAIHLPASWPCPCCVKWRAFPREWAHVRATWPNQPPILSLWNCSHSCLTRKMSPRVAAVLSLLCFPLFWDHLNKDETQILWPLLPWTRSWSFKMD